MKSRSALHPAWFIFIYSCFIFTTLLYSYWIQIDWFVILLDIWQATLLNTDAKA